MALKMKCVFVSNCVSYFRPLLLDAPVFGSEVLRCTHLDTLVAQSLSQLSVILSVCVVYVWCKCIRDATIYHHIVIH